MSLYLLSFFTFVSVSSLTCNETSNPDTFLLCNLFQNITNKPQWWMSNSSACDWYFDGKKGIKCDKNTNKISIINLDSYSLTGYLSTDTKWPSNMKFLSLSNNDIQNTISTIFENLPNSIKYLNLGYNPKLTINESELCNLNLTFDNLVYYNGYKINDISYLECVDNIMPNLEYPNVMNFSNSSNSDVMNNEITTQYNGLIWYIMFEKECTNPDFSIIITSKNSSIEIYEIKINGSLIGDCLSNNCIMNYTLQNVTINEGSIIEITYEYYYSNVSYVYSSKINVKCNVKIRSDKSKNKSSDILLTVAIIAIVLFLSINAAIAGYIAHSKHTKQKNNNKRRLELETVSGQTDDNYNNTSTRDVYSSGMPTAVFATEPYSPVSSSVVFSTSKITSFSPNSPNNNKSSIDLVPNTAEMDIILDINNNDDNKLPKEGVTLVTGASDDHNYNINKKNPSDVRMYVDIIKDMGQNDEINSSDMEIELPPKDTSNEQFLNVDRKDSEIIYDGRRSDEFKDVYSTKEDNNNINFKEIELLSQPKNNLSPKPFKKSSDLGFDGRKSFYKENETDSYEMNKNILPQKVSEVDIDDGKRSKDSSNKFMSTDDKYISPRQKKKRNQNKNKNNNKNKNKNIQNLKNVLNDNDENKNDSSEELYEEYNTNKSSAKQSNVDTSPQRQLSIKDYMSDQVIRKYSTALEGMDNKTRDNTNINNWTREDVVIWLKNILDTDEYEGSILNKNITGTIILNVTKQGLSNLGITDTNHQMIIFNSRQKFQHSYVE